MCGIAGVLRRGGGDEEELQRLALVMASQLRHRGPDDSGVWTDRGGAVALGHTRLAILDLSEAGHQPMQSSDGRYCVVFNGEIYNFRELRRELEKRGCGFESDCDSEVLVEAIAAWGIDASLDRLNGMFAFACWDRDRERLTLARDRIGEKPLYYGRAGQDFVFASELSAVRAHQSFRSEIDRTAVDALVQYGYIPEPLSIFVDIRKLPPGSTLELRATDSEPWTSTPRSYWSLEAVANRVPPARQLPGDLDELERRLAAAVGMRLHADVDLGAFLSGGIDSSLVTALMTEQTRRVDTYSIGFDDGAFDESGFAADVANRLGTNHHEFRVTAEAAEAMVPLVASVYSEPFADSSQIPTMLLCRLAREQVKVALTGDGGDELMGGYRRYVSVPRAWRMIGKTPGHLRRTVDSALSLPSASGWATVGRLAGRQRIGDDVAKGRRLLAARDPDDLYRLAMTMWDPGSVVAPGGRSPWRSPQLPSSSSFVERMMLSDGTRFLPDDVLVKVDRASMAVGLETRLPLLDHSLVEFAWSLPLDFRIRGGTGKWALRQLLARRLPKEIFERAKTGFTPPLANWLRGPLRTWGEGLLDPSRVAEEGWFNADVVDRTWRRHQAGTHNLQEALWPILMFQEWLDSGAAQAASQTHRGLEGVV